MADSPSNPTPPVGERRSSGELPPSASRASVPPSEPRPSRTSLASIDAQVDHPARLQLIVALVLGLVLVAIPLYLWRRPRAESIAVTVSQDAGPAALEPPPPPEERVTVSEPKSSCHDPGPRRTPPDQCDHLVEVEKALVQAAADSGPCLAKEPAGGTIAFSADVVLSSRRRAIVVGTPREGRSVKNAKVVAGCLSAVKAKVQAVSLDGMKHEHQRYRISVVATYPSTPKP